MGPRQFDRLVQSLPNGVSRRGVVRGLGALALGGLAIPPQAEASTKKKNKHTCDGVSAPDPCNSPPPKCGKTSKHGKQCFCVTSVDGVTTCTSVFVNFDRQTADCQSDADCAGFFGSDAEAVCVSSPCFGGGIQNWCVNKGCVNLNRRKSKAQAAGRRRGIQRVGLRPGA